ncbi:MAG: YlxR family protein [Cyanobacteria bacterium J06642_11]
MRPNYRRCVSCRKVAHRNTLLRIVRTSPSGVIRINQGMGRSAYLCHQLQCFNLAHKKNRLGRSLRAKVPEDIYQHLQDHITNSCSTTRMEEHS